jgi:hypothetical protein
MVMVVNGEGSNQEHKSTYTNKRKEFDLGLLSREGTSLLKRTPIVLVSRVLTND